MRLTPAEVHNVAFKKPSIGKRGYDEDEVDAFLDLVEDELARLIEENNELTARLAGGGAAAPVAVPEAPAPVLEKAEAVEAVEVVEEPPAPAPAPVTAGETHVQAARLLGLAQETADRLTAEAKEESDRLLADATAESERVRSEAQTFSDDLLAEAQTKADATESGAQAKADEVLNSLVGQQTELQKKIDDLRTYEREYRSRLKTWITDQLAQLDGTGGETSTTD